MADEVVLEKVAKLVPDGLWRRVQPLLPARPPQRFRHPGRLRAMTAPPSPASFTSTATPTPA